MNILILNASPRPNGGIARMLQAMEEEALAYGARVVNLRVADLKVHPCTGCMTCRTALRCTLPEDDAQCVVRLLGECQVLVIGAPCYWGNMPGTLKALFDRMVYGLIEQSGTGLPRPLHAGKDAVLVSTSTTAFPFNILFHQTSGTIRALKAILKWSGFHIYRRIERGGVRQKPVGEKDLNRCRKVMRKLCK